MGKKSNKKWLIAIVLIVIIVIAAGIYFTGSIPTGLIAGTDETASETTQATGEATKTESEPSKWTVTGNEIIAKETTENLPYYDSIDLEPGKYNLQVVTDKPVWVRLYDELHFTEWEKYGKHGKVVTGTNLGKDDKTENLYKTFFVSKGYGGKHYLLILGNEKTSIKFKITQILKT